MSSRIRSLLRSVPLAAPLYHRSQRLGAYVRYLRDLRAFARAGRRGQERFPVRWRGLVPCVSEWSGTHGLDSHYVYHPAWAARILAATKPPYHVDISSALHFCTLVSAFLPVRYYEYRRLKLDLSDLTTGSVDLLSLPFPDRSIPSLSCMHVVEHIGLGRYGDPIDPDGDLKAMGELKRVLAAGGSLLFVAPTGRRRLQFNAQRIYAYEDVVSCFSELELREFSLITDAGAIVPSAGKAMADQQSYGCGCYWFMRT